MDLSRKVREEIKKERDVIKTGRPYGEIKQSEDNNVSFFLSKKRWRGKSTESRGPFGEIKPFKSARLFDRLFFEVSRLLTYPDWLPVETSQIAFYVEKLKCFSQSSRKFMITDKDKDSVSELLADRTLHILVTAILKYKNARTSVGLSDFDNLPDLARVGNRLALEVIGFYKASKLMFGPTYKWIHGYKEEEFVQSFNFDGPLDLELPALESIWDIGAAGQEKYFSQGFPSQIYFDNKKFQEGEIFVGFQAEASSLLQQLASITKKKEEASSYLNCRDGWTLFQQHSFSCPHSLVNPTPKLQLFHVPTVPSNCSCYSSEVSQSIFKHITILWDTSIQMRALDISSIELLVFPSELLQLVHLRYLELRFRSGDPPEAISHLKELQTLIMSSRMNMVVPSSMWKLIKLKHLCIKSGENIVDSSFLKDEPSILGNLQCMSLVSPTKPCESILARTPNFQKLGLCGRLVTTSGDLKCPDLGLLMQLETLKLLNTIPFCKGVRLSISTIFPGSLKNLTLSNTCLNWEEAWVFEMIPNLEVLKLKFHAFDGNDWETSPEAFPCLKFLKLDELELETWTACRMHFPVLQHLQVYRCPYLNEIPEDFGNIWTLEWLEISGCSDSATNSARDIQKEQESIGNDSLKILLNPGLTKPMHDRAET